MGSVEKPSVSGSTKVIIKLTWVLRIAVKCSKNIWKSHEASIDVRLFLCFHESSWLCSMNWWMGFFVGFHGIHWQTMEIPTIMGHHGSMMWGCPLGVKITKFVGFPEVLVGHSSIQHWFFAIPSLLGAFYAGDFREWSTITINNHPSNPHAHPFPTKHQ